MQKLIIRQLEGQWKFSRHINNGTKVAGQAFFQTISGNKLEYRETGQMDLPNGGTFNAQNKYVFEQTRSGFNVYFNEVPLRLFHQVVLEQQDSKLIGEGTHFCEADTYKTIYQFIQGHTFSIEHIVNGPQKSYQSTSLFTRQRV